MNCIEANEKLLDAAEGVLGEQEDRAIRGHLEACGECRAEYEALVAGLEVVRDAVPRMAPREQYLTRARRERILAAESPRIFRLATYRQFVAAAAAAAILVSIAFIGARVMGIRDAQRLQNAPTVAARTEPAVHYAPVTVSAPGQMQPINVAHMTQPVSAAAPSRGPAAVAALKTDTPGITVPVNHAFYDPEESSHWW